MAKVSDSRPVLANANQPENKPTESKKTASNLNKILCCSCCGDEKEKKKTKKTNIRDLFTLSYWKKKYETKQWLHPSFYKNHPNVTITLLAYLLLNGMLIAITVVNYADFTANVKCARIGGILIAFNSDIVLLLVMRRFITWLRQLKYLHYILPLDDFLMFHKKIGLIILFWVLWHTIFHLVNQCKLFNIRNFFSRKFF